MEKNNVFKNETDIEILSLYQKRKFINDFCRFAKLEIKNHKNKFNKKSLLEIFVSSLDKDSSKIFLEEFIVGDKESEWYLEHWSKGTYYKKLNLLVNQFIRFVNVN